MKILHTSDLHIGKKLILKDRNEEYRAVLSEIKQLCIEEKVELVLVAGDVFDTYTPSAEAEQIFYSGIKSIAEVATVLIISGNHDDYVRLTAAAALAGELGIYIVGNDLKPLPVKKHAHAYPVASGSGYAVFSNPAGEKVYINMLPYPNEARFREEKNEESFTDKMSRWINFGESGNTENLPSLFLSHIFVAGGRISDSEREIDLGGARAVPAEMLPDCAYCALGHLHRRQKIGKNAYYCGAPMQFTFDECNSVKSVNIFDITSSGLTNFKQTPITSAKQLVRVQANDVASGLELLQKYERYHVELTLNLSSPLTPTESALLHSRENLAQLKAQILDSQQDYTVNSNKNKSASELFSEFYRQRVGADVPKELLSLFLSFTEEE